MRRQAGGTYYGPLSVVPREGGYSEWPRIQAVTPEILDYWEHRAAEARHPVLKARYADLVWDLSQKVKGERAGIGTAQCAIDNYAKMVADGQYEHRNQAITYADRALVLAVSVNDGPRIEKVRDTILNLDLAEAPDEEGSGIAFDLLVNNKKVQLPEGILEKVISGQENILGRGLKNAEEENGFPFSVDRAAERLATYYRSLSKHDDVKRVLGLYARARISMAKRADPMLGAAWLRDVYEKIVDFGCPDEAETVALVLRDLSKKSRAQMVQHTQQVEIPTKEVDEWTDEMLSGELPEVLLRVVRQFIPDPDRIEKQVKELAKTAPLMSFLRITQVDAEGREVAQIGSVKDDLEGRIIQHIGQNLTFEGWFLRHVFQELLKRYRVDSDVLLDELMKSPVFEQGRKPTLKRGLDACLCGDHVLAAHLLIPQIEHAVRVLAVAAGSSGYKPNRRQGGIQLKTLGDLLTDSAVVRVLGDRVLTYLKVVLTDPRGWNLRNDLCHGILNPDQLGWVSTDRILHMLLMLGGLRVDGEP